MLSVSHDHRAALWPCPLQCFFGHLISLHVPLETPKWRWLGFAAGRLSRRRGRRCRSLLPLGCGSSAQQKVYCYQTAVPHKVVICIFNGSALKGSVLWRCLPGGFPLRVCVKVCHRVLPLEGVLFSCFLSSPGWISFVLQPPHAQTCAACDTLRGLRYCLKKNEMHNCCAPQEAGDIVWL